MSGEMPMKAVLVSAAKSNPNQNSIRLALSNPDGTDVVGVKPQTKPADSTASTVAGVVTDLNALYAKLVAAGVLK